MRAEIPTRRKVNALKNRLEQWRDAHYYAKLDHEIGEAIENPQMMENAKVAMRNALITIDLLVKKLADLGSEVSNQADEPDPNPLLQ